MQSISSVDWNKCDGLVPSIIQDYTTGAVLMLGFMNEEALSLTLESNEVHYYSRTKGRIWKKGESSKNIQKVKSIGIDCDNDTLLIQVEQIGHTCHTGSSSCFFKDLNQDAIQNTPTILQKLALTLNSRKKSKNKDSYSYSLMSKGDEAVFKKVSEESFEFCFSSIKNSNKNDIIHEGADLMYHFLLALCHKEVDLDVVLKELYKREGIGGMEEKSLRHKEP